MTFDEPRTPKAPAESVWVSTDGDWIALTHDIQAWTSRDTDGIDFSSSPEPGLLAIRARAWRARPGTDPRFSVGVMEQRMIRIPIAGREEWERAARRLA